MNKQQPIITIFGSARVAEGTSDYEEARRVGAFLAQAGFTVCTGGYAGSMEAASRGAREAGGHTLGITLRGFDPRPCNPWVAQEEKIATYLARIERMLELGDGYLALHGGMGTLAEMSSAWSVLTTRLITPRPAVLLGVHWARLLNVFRRELLIPESDYALWQLAATPEEAVARLQQALLRRGSDPQR